MAFVILVFLRGAEDSFIGSSWAAVALVLGPVTDTWLEMANIMSDKDVSEGLLKLGEKNILVGPISLRSKV
jgi:hypothetical protein